MSESRAVDTVSGLDYEEIEQAVMETTRGRWFLNEFARRQHASDTKILLDAIRRLEDQLLAMPAAAPVSTASGQLVTEAEDALHRLSGQTGSDPANARAIAERLAIITSNLRDAARAPAETIAERLKPEIERLQACAGAQDEMAGKIARAAQMVRRLRSSEAIDEQGKTAAPERQLAAPAAEPVTVKPVQPAAPAFVSSDDDLFETEQPTPTLSTAGKAALTATAPVQQAPQPAASRPARSLGADTLDFSSIEVPPLPERVSDDDDNNEDDPAEQVEAAAAEPVATVEDKPDTGNREDELKARDRVIQVTRTSTSNNRRLSDFGPGTSTTMNGRINMGAPAAANQQQTAAAQPTSGTAATGSGADAGSQKKRIIVIRRPAEGTDGIPLAGE